ncbi:hypothetical protein Aduo_010913 [Ancylostoma duodenale]
MSLKSVFQRKNRNYDSDSTGYSSSSDVSSPLSGSQFILRPATEQSICSDQSLYHTLEYEQYPTSSNYTSPSSSLSTSENGDAEEGGDESTIRPHSVLTIRSLKNTTTAKIVACKTAFSSLAIRTRRSRPPLINFNRPEEPQNTEDFLNFDESPPAERQNDDVSLEDLFNAVKLQDDSFPISDGTSSVSSTNRRKQILIKEPDDSSRIYFDYRTKKRLPLPFLNRGSKPRSILKKEPSLSFTHLYEAIDGDHLSPLPDDVRPVIPNRPAVQPMRLFPPCNQFQPRRMDTRRTQTPPTVKKRQKMPSLHSMDQHPVNLTWSRRLGNKLFAKSSSDLRI